MNTILIPFRMVRSPKGGYTFIARDFNYEYSVGPSDDLNNVLVSLTKAFTTHISHHKLTIHSLLQHDAFGEDLDKPYILVPVRISEALGGEVEKVTITMKSELKARIDAHVLNNPQHKSRSSFLADAAVALLLSDSNTTNNL